MASASIAKHYPSVDDLKRDGFWIESTKDRVYPKGHPNEGQLLAKGKPIKSIRQIYRNACVRYVKAGHFGSVAPYQRQGQLRGTGAARMVWDEAKLRAAVSECLEAAELLDPNLRAKVVYDKSGRVLNSAANLEKARQARQVKTKVNEVRKWQCDQRVERAKTPRSAPKLSAQGKANRDAALARGRATRAANAAAKRASAPKSAAKPSAKKSVQYSTEPKFSSGPSLQIVPTGTGADMAVQAMAKEVSPRIPLTTDGRTCQYVFRKGKKAGQKCTSKCLENLDVCRTHWESKSARESVIPNLTVEDIRAMVE